MKKTKVLCAVLVCVMLLFSLAACGKQDELVGKWNCTVSGYENNTCQFNSDGTCETPFVGDTYTVDDKNTLILHSSNGSEIIFYYEGSGLTAPDGRETYYWEINGDSLRLDRATFAREK